MTCLHYNTSPMQSRHIFLTTGNTLDFLINHVQELGKNSFRSWIQNIKPAHSSMCMFFIVAFLKKKNKIIISILVNVSLIYKPDFLLWIMTWLIDSTSVSIKIQTETTFDQSLNLKRCTHIPTVRHCASNH